jgi:hypothetical protein
MRKIFSLVKWRALVLRLLEKLFILLEPIFNKAGLRVVFHTYERRYAGYALKTMPFKVRGVPRIGILIQGPITHPQFLIDTLFNYSKMFPEAALCLSTWENEPSVSQFRQIRNLQIVENARPKDPGISNLNFQAVSTYEGLSTLEDFGVDNVLKIRSDQAILNTAALERMQKRLVTIPPNKLQRILTTDFNSFLFRPYSANDQLMYASLQTLKEFWSAYLNRESYGIIDLKDDFAERLLLKSYLGYLGIPFEGTLRQSLIAYRDLYCFIDNEELDLFWIKGTHRNLRSRFSQQVFPSYDSFVRFSDWLQLQDSVDIYLDYFSNIENT